MVRAWRRANRYQVSHRLLLACAGLTTTDEDKATIRQILGEGIDWTIFARMAVDRGVASLAAHTLVCVAPGMVPQDILEAFREIVARRASAIMRFLG